MEGIVVPRHPSGAMPIMPSFGRDGLRADAHHVEGRRDENESIDLMVLLRHQPRNPAAERIPHDGEPGLPWQAGRGRV